MNKEEHYLRFKAFAIRIVKMVDSMPNTISAKALARQVVRSGTSPSANYRAACKAKSDNDFINKLKMVEEELDETLHWLDIIIETEILPEKRLTDLRNECEELLKITVKSIVTMRSKINRTS